MGEPGKFRRHVLKDCRGEEGLRISRQGRKGKSLIGSSGTGKRACPTAGWNAAAGSTEGTIQTGNAEEKPLCLLPKSLWLRLLPGALWTQTYGAGASGSIADSGHRISSGYICAAFGG